MIKSLDLNRPNLQARELEQKLGRPAGLAFINVGSRSDSELYIRKKQEACERVNLNLGMPFNGIQEHMSARDTATFHGMSFWPTNA